MFGVDPAAGELREYFDFELVVVSRLARKVAVGKVLEVDNGDCALT